MVPSYIYRATIWNNVLCQLIKLTWQSKNIIPNLTWIGFAIHLVLLISAGALRVLATMSAHAGHSTQPTSTSAQMFRCACLQNYLQTSPPTPQNLHPKFQNTRTTFEAEEKPMSGQIYRIVRREEVASEYFFSVILIILCKIPKLW